MNYPVWELTSFGGGFLIALVAVVHVLVSHFAVGGGAFLVLLEKKAYRDEDKGLYSYVKAHARFFLLVTMVFGGLTGVGIWWTISLLNPAATSRLIHIFVFAWAAEWVFFVAEIVALFIYFYTFGRMQRRNHMIIGWLYFFCAWMSLFLINGIIDFMLTPGEWLINANFWSGFFNPTFWPSLLFRTGLSLVLCGVFGFVTASFVKKEELRQKILRTCSLWVILPFVLMLAGLLWYKNALPQDRLEMIFGSSPELGKYMQAHSIFLSILFGAALVMIVRLPQGLQKLLSLVIVMIALVYFGSFEFLREGARRPFIIADHMYSNQLYLDDMGQINSEGYLKRAIWSEIKEVNESNMLQAGHELFNFQCSACHSVDGPLNDVLPLAAKYRTVFAMDAKLSGIGKLNMYMPPFAGNAAEREALASYIVHELNGVADDQAEEPALPAVEHDPERIPFDKDKDEYVLLAWSTLGMHCLSDSDPYWSLSPPGNDIFAQLILRGDSPELITEEVELEYQVEKGFDSPQNHVRFWDFAEKLLGVKLEKGLGTEGLGLNGKMKLEEEHSAFIAASVPVVPYKADGSFAPYPVFTITARDAQTGDILARTRTIVPVSTEMGCKNCHGGEWRIQGLAGLSDETSLDVLLMHDKNSGTRLAERAKAGEPMLCRQCHTDPASGAKGQPELLNLSAAIHGWHANFLTGQEGMTACVSCHPAGDDGATRFFRSHHSDFMDCTNCHGTMEDHSLSLLKQEKAAGKKGAERLMKHLLVRNADSLEEINGRTPWIGEPDCLNCHIDYEMADTEEAYNSWTDSTEELFRLRHDEMEALMCQACHSSAHAVYPAVNNIYGSSLDSMQPLQYQDSDRPIGNDCMVCHTVQPEDEMHHPNSLRM